jgi:iron only hydrogenase large subunit-like protein
MKNSVIQWDSGKCKTCYSCIRACKVKAIHVKNNSVFPYFEEAQCIHCGHCIAACAYHAISYFDSKEQVKTMLNSGSKVAAICAPSIAGEFVDIADYRKFVKMIRYLGFSYVNEMSFGVDIVAAKYRELTTQNSNGKFYLTSHCPCVVELIEKSYPDLISNLLPIVTPAAAMAVILRKLHGKTLKIVQITPCVAAKNGVERYNKGTGKIDAVITFKELRDLFEEFKIKEAYTESSEFDTPFGYKGGLYPVAQGFVEATNLDITILKGNTQTIEGSHNAIEAIRQFKDYHDTIRSNMNIFYCEGCISGPGMSQSGNKYLKQTFTKDYVKKRLLNFELDRWHGEIMQHMRYKELEATFDNKKYKIGCGDETQVLVMQRILQQITELKKGIELNCGACGYETCRGLALAVTQGIAIPEMCVPNSQLGSREAVIDMRRNTEDLEKTQERVKELEKETNTLTTKANSLKSAFTIFIRNLNPGIVITNPELKVVDANQSFVEILGEDALEIHDVIPFLIGADIKTLLPSNLVSQLNYMMQHEEEKFVKDVEINDKLTNCTLFQLIPNQLYGIVMRNLHSKEERPEEIINRINKVIEENLRQVQQIGFILGEGAAKTEKMLNTIIETYK